ncbi:MAG: heme exporter protein CcmD [Burkholderiaceae bacterium]
MIWSSSVEFFAMGGYALYVWGSLSVTLVAILTECFFLRYRRKAALLHVQRSSNSHEEARL